jgi:hypothetical protein
VYEESFFPQKIDKEFFFRKKMKRVDVDSLTDCADDLSLHNFKRTKKSITTALFKVVSNIWKKASVDFIFLAIAEVLKKELKFQTCQPTLDDINMILTHIEFLLKSLNIPNFVVIDDDLYIDGELFNRENISYAVITTPDIEEAMQTLRFPICLNIHLKRTNNYPLKFSVIREVHSRTVLLWSNHTSAKIYGAMAKIDVDNEVLNTWIANSTYAMRNPRKLLC